MRRVKSRDTSPEIAFRKALWAAGVRYRLHRASLPGKPDIVIAKKRLAVFIDGDFWHGNQWRSRGYPSLEAQFVASPMADYWVPKIDRNMRRDRLNTAALLEQGWSVIRFWESDIKSNLRQCVDLALRAIEDCQTGFTSAERNLEDLTTKSIHGQILRPKPCEHKPPGRKNLRDVGW